MTISLRSHMNFASVSLDLDNEWSYLKTHGNPAWKEHSSYFSVVVPRILEWLKRRDLTISFFIVGQDAAIAENKTPLRSIADAGHEISCHSFNHDPWLHLYSRRELELELQLAEDAILAATGQKPVGFRGPGFSLSEETLDVLLDRGYEYDASVFPNLLNPLARAYFFSTSALSTEEKKQRSELFGTWKDARRPVKPFLWKLRKGSLLEIPVTTMPVFKVPIHLSYLIYLASFSRLAARAYFRLALQVCRWTGTQPSILLHPLDFLGAEDCPRLAFFPGMRMTWLQKQKMVDELIGILVERYRVITMREHAHRMAAADVSLQPIEPAQVSV